MDKRVQPRIFFSDEQKKELHQKIKSNLIGIRSNYREILRNLRQKPHEGSSETVLQSIKPLDDFEYIIRANQMTQSAEAFLECISELQVNHSLLDFYSLDNQLQESKKRYKNVTDQVRSDLLHLRGEIFQLIQDMSQFYYQSTDI